MRPRVLGKVLDCLITTLLKPDSLSSVPRQTQHGVSIQVEFDGKLRDDEQVCARFAFHGGISMRFRRKGCKIISRPGSLIRRTGQDETDGKSTPPFAHCASPHQFSDHTANGLRIGIHNADTIRHGVIYPRRRRSGCGTSARDARGVRGIPACRWRGPNNRQEPLPKTAGRGRCADSARGSKTPTSEPSA